MTFNEMLEDLVNQDDEFKVKLAVDNYLELLPTFRKFDPKTEGMIITYAIFATTVAADGNLTPAEFDFIYALLAATGHETGEDDLLSLIRAAARDDTAYNVVKDVKDHLNKEGRIKLITLIAVICSVDDSISREEVAYIASLLN